LEAGKNRSNLLKFVSYHSSHIRGFESCSSDHIIFQILTDIGFGRLKPDLPFFIFEN
jgi:hypothetical protein